MSFEGAHAGGSYLRAYLSHLDAFLDRPDVTDIYINRPGEVWIEALGAAPERHDVPGLDAKTLDRLARQIASRSSQGISRHHPLLAASLPDGARVQIIAPPATRDHVAIAIRRQAIREMALDDCIAAGLFDQTRVGNTVELPTETDRLKGLLDAGDFAGFLKAAIVARKNIIVSGGTSTGKTTFLNALLQQIPQDERIIAIEDTPEVRLSHPNAIGLIASRSDLGEAQVTIEDLLQASLRMRPSRIIMGELRGAEAYSFLRAVNTGHPGSITTVHADSPRGAAEQLALMVLQSGTTLARADVLDYVRSTVEIIVQLSRVNGKRIVSTISYEPA
ncbi:P-type DNA transfer ATPase VirB11 [Sphingomonas nostoxanthinifaciens]|uniref:P-type DNA transfer ATPase VirB11 n=1 Tax=Sphingomonas nostoxanthinifaciens TaxID=2872652 RepID=UPI001CC1E570|nr:P-type DNA transfer ATPase VirB11 [Sphingomonas nostoxanthinifaciens]UAK23260.1 P-type DNA transfer ATPase VirB11 [Sphingomonas nostoxanthinifaciens]